MNIDDLPPHLLFVMEGRARKDNPKRKYSVHIFQINHRYQWTVTPFTRKGQLAREFTQFGSAETGKEAYYEATAAVMLRYVREAYYPELAYRMLHLFRRSHH